MLDNADFSEAGRSAELARLLIDRSSVLATVAVMPSGRVVGANSIFLALLGISSQSAIIGHDFRELLAHSDDWRHWERAVTAGQIGIENIPLKAPGGGQAVVSGDIFSLPTGTDADSPLFAALIGALPGVRAFGSDHRGAAVGMSSGLPGDSPEPDLPAPSISSDESAVSTTQLKRLPAGSENLLLVADDAGRAKAIGDTLMMLGYSVFVSAEPAETMRQASRDEFPLVIVDASASTRVDPGRFAEALKRFGGRSALLIIGSPELEYLAHHEHVEFLRKPVSLVDLATSVRSVLDRQRFA